MHFLYLDNKNKINMFEKCGILNFIGGSFMD